MARRSGLNFSKKRRKIETAVVKEIFSWITGVFVAILLAFVLVYCVGMTTSVIGISMQPTLENSEKIMVNRFVYMISSPKQNDVIVFVPNGSMKSHYYVKRVVGTPGDTVQIIDGHLYINDELFVKALELNIINEKQLQMLRDFKKDQMGSMKQFLIDHPEFLEESLNSDNSKTAKRAKLLVEQDLYGLNNN